MDVLEKYKKAWGNQPEEANKVSKVEIYKMAQEKSSSIVKWIFIISIIEFVVLNGMNFFFSDNTKKTIKLVEELHLTSFFTIFMILSYGILFYFLYQFYKNYKNICVVDDTKTLMKKILKTRKTVKHYVLFNLISMVFFSVVLITAIYIEKFENIATTKLLVLILVLTVVLSIVVLLIWLFYQLAYGILLKKLNRNYKELAKLDGLK